MYNQKYTTTTKVTAGSNNNSQARTNGSGGGSALGAVGGSSSSSSTATNQYLQSRQQQLHNGATTVVYGTGLNGAGAPSTSPGGPMRSPPPAELQRRESLVKPTWANISPGQVPSTTFDELVNSANGAAALHQDLKEGYGGSAVVESDTQQSELGMLSNKLLAKNGLNQRQKKREVELFDIFGKVCTWMDGLQAGE